MAAPAEKKLTDLSGVWRMVRHSVASYSQLLMSLQNKSLSDDFDHILEMVTSAVTLVALSYLHQAHNSVHSKE